MPIRLLGCLAKRVRPCRLCRSAWYLLLSDFDGERMLTEFLGTFSRIDHFFPNNTYFGSADRDRHYPHNGLACTVPERTLWSDYFSSSTIVPALHGYEPEFSTMEILQTTLLPVTFASLSIPVLFHGCLSHGCISCCRSVGIYEFGTG